MADAEPAPTRPPRDALDETILRLGREGWSLPWIAVATGRSRSVLWWRLRRMGVTIAQLRDVHCPYCGALMQRAGHGATRACARPACRAQRLRVAVRNYERHRDPLRVT